MVCKTTIDKTPLLPDRQQQQDFFVCDIFDAVPKGDMASMAHPVFTISLKPDMKRRRYENGPHFIEVRPSDVGLATVHDRDILIFCISQIMAALNRGQRVERKMRFKAYDFLTATNRRTGGEAYQRLREALERLSGTRIQTNVVTGGEELLDDFGLIDRFRILRQTREGRMQEIEIELSDWVFNAINSHEVLTLHRDYFRLRKPLERRLYEIARKHCGAQPSWTVSLEKLQYKCGSTSTGKEFKRLIAKIIAENATYGHIPDYDINLDGSNVVFVSRGSVRKRALPSDSLVPPLNPDTYERARAAAQGWDVHQLESEWREWITECPRNPDAAFVGFCRKVFENRGRP